jgi:hypothetical protein
MTRSSVVFPNKASNTPGPEGVHRLLLGDVICSIFGFLYTAIAHSSDN